jgi:hypothetical protein
LREFGEKMSSTGANATPNGPHKVAKKVERNGKQFGKDDADDDTNKNAGLVKVAGTVAGVAVVAGIAFTVYKSFRNEDHPLANTEEGIKQDASNAIDGTKVRDPHDSSLCEFQVSRPTRVIIDCAEIL